MFCEFFVSQINAISSPLSPRLSWFLLSLSIDRFLSPLSASLLSLLISRFLSPFFSSLFQFLDFSVAIPTGFLNNKELG